MEFKTPVQDPLQDRPPTLPSQKERGISGCHPSLRSNEHLQGGCDCEAQGVLKKSYKGNAWIRGVEGGWYLLVCQQSLARGMQLQGRHPWGGEGGQGGLWEGRTFLSVNDHL